MFSQEDISHLSDPSQLDPHASDHLNRQGPKAGIHLSLDQAQSIFRRIKPSATISSYLVSSKGYNNRLYYITITPSSDHHVTDADADALLTEYFIIKVCGRYWYRTKTETEVIGIWLANTYAELPAPMIMDWDADGKEFGVEYTVMPKLPGRSLDGMWKELSMEARQDLLNQLAGMVIAFKTKVTSAVGGQKIGNWSIKRGRMSEQPGQRIIESDFGFGFEVGPTLDGDGPWTSYKSYLRTMLDKQLSIAHKEPVLSPMSHVWQRVENLLENLQNDRNIPDEPNFVFTHGDLDVQNILVEPSSTSEVGKWKITALLDWEWSGMFPAEEEYFASYGFFIGEDEDDENKKDESNLFYDMLEAGGVATPRTIPNFARRKALYDLRENLAPWFLLDVDEPESEEVREKAARAEALVVRCLDLLGY